MNTQDREALAAAARSEWASLAVEHAANLERFRKFCRALFATKTEGKTFTRKPPVGLRVMGAGNEGRLVAGPVFYRRKRGGELTLYDDCVNVEFIVERPIEAAGGVMGFKAWRCFTIHLNAREARLGSFYVTDFAKHARTALGIVHDFVADPNSVMQRCSSHCGMCGRCLTDGTSQARGIGPECIVNWAAATRLSIFEKQRAPEQRDLFAEVPS